eukprot:scaffold22656_cov147-Skeletonema_menzelii.AAC.7
MHYARAFVAAASFAYNARHSHRQGATSLSVMHQCTKSSDDDSSLTIDNLLQRAQTIRSEMYGDSSPSFIFDHEQLAYPNSSYEMKLENEGILQRRRNSKSSTVKRGFCNWLIPQRIMIGQYPGMTPESNGPTSKESQIHIQNMVQDAKINKVCCLQTEVPSQSDDVKWDALGGEVYLDPTLRREFPRPFTRYGPLAQTLSDSSVEFLHSPIEDLGTPSCNDSLLRLLSALLHHLESNADNTLYLHCWGGRGRAGLIGACTTSLLFPELTSQEILAWVQGGYDTRAGAKAMHRGLRRSPQTEQQREFVREFVTLVKDAKGNMP